MKGVSEIIATVLVIAITISLISIAYTWGLPLIQKKIGESIAERVHSYFNPSNAGSIQRKITEVIVLGGENIFNMDADGVWSINTTENSIEFMFFSKSTKVAPNVGWIPIFGGGSCALDDGWLGIDVPYVTCASAINLDDGYEIRYKAWFRKLLEQPPSNKGQLIMLISDGPSSYAGKYLRITRGNIYTESDITKIEIKIKLG